MNVITLAAQLSRMGNFSIVTNPAKAVYQEKNSPIIPVVSFCIVFILVPI